MALAGLSSRRKAEEYILKGEVAVNGEPVYELGTTVDPKNDLITVNGRPLEMPENVYYILNKPRGYLTSMSDARGRPTVMDLMRGVEERVFPVGRLDYASEGLLIFTNDGDWAEKVIHPKHKRTRTYLAKVRGRLKDDDLEALRMGVQLSDGFVEPVSVERSKQLKSREWVQIELMEGKNLEVRRLFKKLGYEVDRLRRIALGRVTIKGVSVGKFRPLSRREIDQLASPAIQKDTKKVTRKKLQRGGVSRGK